MPVNHDEQAKDYQSRPHALWTGCDHLGLGFRQANPEPLVHRRGGLTALEPATQDGSSASPAPTAPTDSIRPVAGGGADPSNDG
jgi:hypothetical protein